MPRKPGKADKPLNIRQEKFCNFLIADEHQEQTGAAIKAGFAKRSAAVTACQLMKMPRIQARIQQLMTERMKRVRVDADYVLLEAKDLYELAKEKLQGEFTPQLLTPTLKALEMVGKHVAVGAFRDNIALTGEGGGPVRWEIVGKKADAR